MTFAPKPFVPRRWLANGHLQTIFGNFLPRPDHLPPATAELIEVSPATLNQIASQVLCHCHWQPEAVRSERLTVIVLHGLEGSSQSQYVIGNANKMWRAGLNVVRMNMRNCGGTESLSPTLYHSGLSGDVAAVMTAVTRRFQLQRVALVGYSMGGNLVLKLAGDLAANLPPQLRAVVGVSPAMDLGPSADALHLPANRLYERKFLRALLKRFRRKAALFPRVYDPARADGIHSLRDFDERITALYNGFAGADDYYYRAAAARGARPHCRAHADPARARRPLHSHPPGNPRDDPRQPAHHAARARAWRPLRLSGQAGRRRRRLLGGVHPAAVPAGADLGSCLLIVIPEGNLG